MIQLYTAGTPNGHKVSIALEELGLEYQAHPVDLGAGEQHAPEFLGRNPNGKIPVLVDPDGPDGKALAVFESGAILLYLAEKSGKLLPRDGAGRSRAIQWLMFQMGGVGPMFGQAWHFLKRAPAGNEYGRDRYIAEAERLVGVLERRLGEADYLAGPEFSVADIATFPWIRAVRGLEWFQDISHPNLDSWLAGIEARAGVQRGLLVPG